LGPGPVLIVVLATGFGPYPLVVARAVAGARPAPRLLDAAGTLWVAWLVIMADGKVTDDEALLMRHLVRLVKERHQVADEKLARLVDVDPAEVWRRLDAEPGDVSDLVDVANRVATVDGAANALERGTISELQDRCGEAHIVIHHPTKQRDARQTVDPRSRS